VKWFRVVAWAVVWAAILGIAGERPRLVHGETPPTAATPVISSQQIEADWLRQAALRCHPTAAGKKIAPAEDARGGCDGVKTGRWGFHTENEPNPWWQVDLGRSTSIDRVVLYNRCDSTAARTARIMILLSADGRTFQQAYQHDGHTFYGYTDKKPLVVSLHGAPARYLRLQLPGKSYFHLDEVEVYSRGENRNVALGRPATQSSTSTWSVEHLQTAAAVPDGAAALKIVARGLSLAEDLRRRGVAVAGEIAALEKIAARAKQIAADAPQALRQDLYFQACWTVRRLALANPLLDFDAILFAKSAPGRFPHMSDQFYGWWSRPGGGIFVLDGFKTAQPRLRCLTADMPPGSFLRPELSYDATKVLFAYCKYYPHVADLKDKADKANLPADAFYHVFEMNLDGSGRRQLTRGRYDDFDACWLPSGQIVFLSTRKGQFLQASGAHTAATLADDLPDSYVRCGGDNYRPVPVFTLHAMDARGGHLHPLSAFENFEWAPAVANDGRILYTRWDYIDRFNGHFFSLWSANPDGGNPQLVYGNYTTRPQVKCEVRPIPNSQKLIFTACAHHSILGGSLVLLDRKRSTEGADAIERLTPEVPFPETEANVDSYYANPYPLSEEHYLVGWADHRLPPHCRVDDTERNPVNAMGLYLYDRFGNLNLLYRDPAISSGNPVPVRRRPPPPVYSDSVAWDGDAEGCFLLEDVYQGLDFLPRGSVKSLRVVAVPPKVQPQMNRPSLGVSREDPGKFLLGSVPVEADGSAYFRVPSGMPLLLHAVDAEGLAVQTMRSLTYVGPGQTLSCIGCHESREAAPPAQGKRPLAAMRAPSALLPGPEGAWPLRYDRLVQPVLDRDCVSCHRSGGSDPRAARLDLRPASSYDQLLAFGGNDLAQLAHERDRSIAGHCVARKSKLWALLADAKGHAGVHLDRDSLNRFAVWMDLYAQRQGHYSDAQEQQLHRLRDQLAPLLAK